MKKECLRKVVKKIKDIIQPTKKNIIERRKSDRRTADRRWMSKISTDAKSSLHRSEDRRMGERRKS